MEKDATLLESVLRYLGILLRYKLFIIIATCAAGILAMGFAILSLKLPPEKSPLPNTYMAEATLIIRQNAGSDIGSSIMSAMGLDPGTSNAASGYDNGELVLQILKSRWLLDTLIEQQNIVARYHIQENVKGRSRNLVLGKSRLTYTRNNGCVSIAYEDIDPVFSRDMVNGMISLVDQWFRQNHGMAKNQQMQMLEEKVAEVKTEIQTLENRLINLQKKYGVLTAQELGTTQAASLADLRSQLILRDIEIKNYSSFSKIDDPRLEQLREERQNIQDLITQIQKGLPEFQQAPGGSSNTTDSTLKSLPDVAQEFTQLTLELDIQRRIYNTISPQYEAAKLSTDTEPIFQVLDMAEIPDMKSGPQRSRIVLYAILGGFFGSIILSFGLNMISKVKSDPEKRNLLRKK